MTRKTPFLARRPRVRSTPTPTPPSWRRCSPPSRTGQRRRTMKIPPPSGCWAEAGALWVCWDSALRQGCLRWRGVAVAAVTTVIRPLALSRLGRRDRLLGGIRLVPQIPAAPQIPRIPLVPRILPMRPARQTCPTLQVRLTTPNLRAHRSLPTALAHPRLPPTALNWILLNPLSPPPSPPSPLNRLNRLNPWMRACQMTLPRTSLNRRPPSRLRLPLPRR